MKLNYIKISKELYKFFYEGTEGYGEFYLKIKPERGKEVTAIASGTAEIQRKDPDYAEPLITAFTKEMRSLR